MCAHMCACDLGLELSGQVFVTGVKGTLFRDIVLELYQSFL